MKAVYSVSDNIISGLGTTTADNFSAVLQGRTGVSCRDVGSLSPVSFQASLLDDGQFSLPETLGNYSRFERLVISGVQKALEQTDVRLDDPSTVFILSTTKGNIDLLHNGEPLSQGLFLPYTAHKIAAFFRHRNTPIVVDHACASGVSALIVGSRLLRTGKYKHAVIAGADLVTRFVLSGFQAFQATSDALCRPFDADRKGLNLGEAGATVVLSTEARCNADTAQIQIGEGASSNDANHISGPSRTGAELSHAILLAIKRSGYKPVEVSFISAHGTATPFNDEMESKAFELSGLSSIPVNSLKGNFGHTLGAAGLLESVLSIQSLRQNIVLPTLGFENHGVSGQITVCKTAINKPLQVCLKTSSGFGGCNAVVLIEKK